MKFSFVRLHIAYPLAINPDETAARICVAKGRELDRGCDYEFLLEWVKLDSGRPVFQLCMFEDGLAALHDFPGFFAQLAELHGTNPSEAKIIKLLLACGATDATPTSAQHHALRCPCCRQKLPRK